MYLQVRNILFVLFFVNLFVLIFIFKGHTAEISKVNFNSKGNLLMTGSSDKTVKLWDVDTGNCTQTLEGHKEEIFSCAFNYYGNTIITASKDNTCRIWKETGTKNFQEVKNKDEDDDE